MEIIIGAETNLKIDQIDIANYFGVNLPRDYHNPNLKKLKNKSFDSNPNNYGIILQDKSINNFFKYYSIPLKETYLQINLFSDWTFEDKVLELLSQEVYIICGYDYNMLHGKSPSEIGHVSILVDYRKTDNMLTIYDPGPDKPGYKNVDLYSLYASIKSKKDGLWLISKDDNSNV